MDPPTASTELEFLPEDFTIINYYMSQSRESWFTFYVVCVRMLLDEKGEAIVGDLTLFNDTLKRRVGATSEVLQCFASEEAMYWPLLKRRTKNVHSLR